MGNNTSQPKLVLRDGTEVGVASREGQDFAQAIARMHCIFKSCDDEFAVLSEARNIHGRESDAYKAAAVKLDACQRRRIVQFQAIEARCGPAQGGYGQCVKDKGADKAHECLPVLQTFLDCAERAVDNDKGREQ